MTTRQTSHSPCFPTCTSASPSDEASEVGPPTSSVPSPGLASTHRQGDGRPTSGSSPVVGTSCCGDDPPKLVAVMGGGDDDNKAAVAAAAQRLQVHWSHGRKRRASGDSHEVRTTVLAISSTQTQPKLPNPTPIQRRCSDAPNCKFSQSKIIAYQRKVTYMM